VEYWPESCGNSTWGELVEMPHMGRLLFAVVVVFAALAAAGVAPAGQLAAVSHFQCYRVDPGTPFKARTVVLSTQFGRVKAAVAQLAVLCAPASKNGSPITNKAAHLACYPIKTAPAFAPKSVFISNQFEKSTPMTVVAPTTLCLPSGKALASTSPPPLVKGLDYYECYSAKPQKPLPTHPITVIDQFGKAGGSALQPMGLCAPAQLNASTLIDKATHLLCYGEKLGPNVVPKKVAIHNIFGVQTATVFERQSLCIPSTKKLG
jgi:hypothetical protein